MHDTKFTVTVFHTFNTSLTNYRNGLLYDISDYNINCLQRFTTGSLENKIISTQFVKEYIGCQTEGIYLRALPATYESINGGAP